MLRLLLSCGTPLVFCASLNDTIDIVDGNIRSFTALFSIRYIYTYHLRIKLPVQLDHSQIKVRDLKNVSVDTHNRYIISSISSTSRFVELATIWQIRSSIVV